MNAAIARFDNAPIIDGVEPVRTAHATLISGRSTPMTRTELATLPVPQATSTHKPVPHIELIRGIEFALGEQQISITNEKFSVNREGNAMFGVMDLAGITGMSLEGFGAALGLRTANDRTMSIQLGVGAKVFICDNLAFHADMIALRKKHTSGLDLISNLRDAVRRFIEKFWVMSKQFDDLKSTVITDDQARVRIYDAFAKEILAPRYFPAVHQAYFGTVDTTVESAAAGAQVVPFDPQFKGTVWALHNAFTWALKSASLPVQQAVTQRLATEFALTA